MMRSSVANAASACRSATAAAAALKAAIRSAPSPSSPSSVGVPPCAARASPGTVSWLRLMLVGVADHVTERQGTHIGYASSCRLAATLEIG